MQTMRDEMIAKGLIQPREEFRKKATELERKYDEATARLAIYDKERARTNKEADLAKATATVAPKAVELGATKKVPTRQIKLAKVSIEWQIEAIRQEIETKTSLLTLNLPLTRREKLLLRRIAGGRLTYEEREKTQRSFSSSRKQQEALWKKSEAKRLARKVLDASSKRKRPRSKLWISLPSKGSSMFGGVKYSHVSVWQGGLPSLGKRK